MAYLPYASWCKLTSEPCFRTVATNAIPSYTVYRIPTCYVLLQETTHNDVILRHGCRCLALPRYDGRCYRLRCEALAFGWSARGAHPCQA